MGNQPTTELVVIRKALSGEWTLEGRTDYCQLVRNNFTHQQAQQYFIPSPAIAANKNLQMYQYRRTHNTTSVGVYHVEKEQGNYLCQGQDYLRVRTERIPTRLSEMNGISEKEAVRILQGTMQGYKGLFEHFGGFHINDEMIGVNQKGQIKVWINSNFAMNSVEGFPQMGNRIISQGDVVNQIFSVVEEHLEAKSFSNSFKDNVLRKYPKSFDEAIQLIRLFQSKLKGGSNQPIPMSGSKIKTSNAVKGVQHPLQYSTFQHRHLENVSHSQSLLGFQGSSIYSSTNSSLATLPRQVQQIGNHHQSSAMLEKSRLVQSPSHQHHQLQHNTISYYQQPRLNIQQTPSNPSLFKSRLDFSIKQNPLKKVDLPQQRTDRSLVLDRNRGLRIDQTSPKMQSHFSRVEQPKGERRTSLNNYKLPWNEIEIKQEPSFEDNKRVNHNFQTRSYQTKSFMSKSVSKQPAQEFNAGQALPPNRTTQAPFLPVTSESRISHHPPKNVSHRNSAIGSPTTISPPASSLTPHPPARFIAPSAPSVPLQTPKQQYKVFPKPSLAIQRMNIQKLDSQSSNTSNPQADMINAMNSISGIESEQNKTISKYSRDQAQILIQINQSPFDFPSTTLTDQVRPEIRKMMTPKPSPNTNSNESKTIHYQPNTPSAGYHYQFQKTKIMPSSLKYNFQGEPNTHQRNITTPRFEYKSRSKEQTNLLSTEIERMIQEHEADKLELLKKIEEYQRSSRFNRATYDLGRIESTDTNLGLKNSKTSNSSKDYVMADLYKQLDRPRY